MRPFCDCEFCTQDRRHRARALGEQDTPAMATDALALGVAIALPALAILGALVAWWVQ